MKKLAIAILVLILGPAIGVASEKGEAIFKSQRCASCHHAESSSKVNPSLTDIARAYGGKADQLIRYLKGESDSIVKPEKSSMMKRYIKKTQALSDEDRKALVDFILSH